jgi:hypothetical protein
MNIQDDLHDDELLGRAIGEALRHHFAAEGPLPAAHPLWLQGRRRRRWRLLSASLGTGVTATAVGVAAVLAMSGGAATPGAPASVTPGTADTVATTSAPAASSAFVPPGATAGPDANHRYCYYRAPAGGTPPKMTDDWCFGTRQELDSYASNAAGRNDDSNPSLSVNPPNATPHPTDGASPGTG